MIQPAQSSIRIRVAVILIEHDTVLLVQHQKYGKKYWLLPGGGVEYGETLESCAIREMKEETNLDIELGDLVLVNESIPPDQHRHVLNLFYWGKIIGGSLKVGKDDILINAAFRKISELPELLMYPNVKKEIIEIIQKRYQGKISLGNRWE